MFEYKRVADVRLRNQTDYNAALAEKNQADIEYVAIMADVDLDPEEIGGLADE